MPTLLEVKSSVLGMYDGEVTTCVTMDIFTIDHNANCSPACPWHLESHEKVDNHLAVLWQAYFTLSHFHFNLKY